MDIPLETEAKFICPAEITKDQIANITQSSGLEIQWHKVKHHEDEYWDTKDCILFKSDISLRCRKKLTEHPDSKITTFTGTLKLPKTRNGAILERYEMEWKIKASSEAKCFPESFPADIKQSLAKYIVDNTLLSPVLEVSTMRQTASILRANNMDIECALDQSIFKGQYGKTSQDEIELEMKEGNKEEFVAFAIKMQKELNLQPSSNSKYAFGIKAVVKP